MDIASVIELSYGYQKLSRKVSSCMKSMQLKEIYNKNIQQLVYLPLFGETSCVDSKLFLSLVALNSDLSRRRSRSRRGKGLPRPLGTYVVLD